MEIVVVGGGASGMMAAIQAAVCGAKVTLLEQNEKLGKKILASGNGKCNMTNTLQEPSCYRGEHPEFAWDLLQMYGLQETIRFFTQLGVYTKNKNGWIYPYNEQAASVLEVLLMEMKHLKVKVKTNEEVTAIRSFDNGFEVKTKTWTYPCERVIVATGSPASAVKGSSDRGYTLAKAVGHPVIQPLPALVSLKGVGNYFPKWAGIRMEGAATLLIEDEPHMTTRGELQFTDYGLSGIPIFQFSRFAVKALENGEKVTVTIDFMPDFTDESLAVFLEKRVESCPYKSMKESLIGLLPKKLIPLIYSEFSSVSELAGRLKRYPVGIKAAHSLEQAQVCSGGVDTSQLNCTSMESRLIPGLYFTGEVVDVDGDCGGYNLQWAWSSGAIAGKHAARSSMEEVLVQPKAEL